MLALTFSNESDYDLIQENDRISFIDLKDFSPSRHLKVRLRHDDGSYDVIKLNHSYNSSQIEWYNLGSALNLIKRYSR